MNIYKISILLILSIFINYFTYAQKLYFASSAFNGVTLEAFCNIYELDVNTCEKRVVCTYSGDFGQIAFHPNGKLYYLANVYNINTGTFEKELKLYEVDLATCGRRQLNFKLTILNSEYITFQINHKGEFLFDYVLNETKIIKYNPTLEKSDTVTYDYYVGDLMYFKNQQYGIVYDNNTIPIFSKINSTSQYDELIRVGNTSDYIYGSTLNTSGNCNDEVLYILKNRVIWNDVEFFIYNDITNKMESLCKLGSETSYSNCSFTNPTEFLSSDPECDLLIDLDRDNSSGVYPYDYKTPLSCGATTYPIADKDLYIHTSRDDTYLIPAIDSVSLILSGIKDIGQESLIYIGNHPSVQLVKKSNANYVLKFNGDVADTVVRDALKKIYYQNTASTISSGERVITLQGYSDLKKGVEVMAYLPMYARPDVGRDTSVSYCDALKIADMKSVIGTTTNGLWQPPLKTNNQYDSKYDVEAKYTFITKDSVCGVDSAQVSISKLPNPITLLPKDTTLCKGEMLQVTLNTSDQIKWGDGDTKKSKSIGQGVHKLTIKNIFGCATEDTLVILPSNKKIPIQKSIALCENDTYTFDGKIYKAGQKITYISPSETTCDSLIEISLILSPYAIGQKDTMTCDNQPFNYQDKMYKIGDTIVYRKLNNVTCDSLIYVVYKSKTLVTYNIDANKDSICRGGTALLTATQGQSYKWSNGNTAQTISATSGDYHVTITDTEGCIYKVSKKIAVYPEHYISIAIGDASCDEDNGRIIIKADGISEIKLNGKSATAMMEDLKADKYTLSYKDIHDCTHDSIIIINKAPLIPIGILSQYTIMPGDSIVIATNGKVKRAVSKDAVIRLGNNTLNLLPQKAAYITIEVEDKEGCIYELYTQVSYLANKDIVVPNIVKSESTTNGIWTVHLSEGKKIKHCEIRDRWGNIVYRSTAAADWHGDLNGTPVDSGVYLYYLIIEHEDTALSYHRGDITVVR